MAGKPVFTATRVLRALFTISIGAAILLSTALPAAAQKEKKKKNQPETHTTIPMPDEQMIDYKISEMLGAWQLGDVDRLRQAYADDAVFVSGVWAPPVFGWNNYLPIYQQQRARTQQVRMDRSNTYIKVSGTVGWACYQWDFGGTVDGQPMTSHGQTTLVLQKMGDHWVIVHNHTSVAQAAPTVTSQPQQPVGSPSTTPQPGKPPAR